MQAAADARPSAMVSVIGLAADKVSFLASYQMIIQHLHTCITLQSVTLLTCIAKYCKMK